MSATLFRVVNQGLVKNSLLIDKVDFSTGNSEKRSHARTPKQAVYVPLLNPKDKTVRGYIDMIPTDEVLLSLQGKGTLAQLVAKGYVSVTPFNSSLVATPVITAAVHSGSPNKTTITGTTMASLAPDVTYVTLTNLTGGTQTLTDQQIIAAGAPSSFSSTSIVIADALLTIGTPTTGWKVQIRANTKSSNVFTL